MINEVFAPNNIDEVGTLIGVEKNLWESEDDLSCHLLGWCRSLPAKFNFVALEGSSILQINT